jgi:hypothetical protein
MEGGAKAEVPKLPMSKLRGGGALPVFCGRVRTRWGMNM